MGTEQPRYQRASYGHEQVLENGRIRLLMFKRMSGWGWGEIRTPDGRHVAVLDHLGETMLRDQDIPMRLEAERHTPGVIGRRGSTLSSTSNRLWSVKSSRGRRLNNE